MSPSGTPETGNPPAPADIRDLGGRAALNSVGALSEILVDCVENGASVSFMSPLSRETAEAFWRQVAEGVDAGARVLLVAADPGTGEMIGTVQLVLAQPENQPHRADLSKMLVKTGHRNRGIGAALMRAAEAAALRAGKTLLVLDTASDAAERLYEREGWTRVGAIPGYALLPDGRPCDTVYFYKTMA